MVEELQSSNIAASGPAIYTSNGEPYENVEYEAVFVNSKVSYIKQTIYEKKPAWPISKLAIKEKISDEKLAKTEARRKESLLGKTVYVLYGGQETGYYAEVVAENEKQWCLKKTNCEFQLMYRCQRDNLIFDTEADALNNRAESKKEWDDVANEYAEFVKTQKI